MLRNFAYGGLALVGGAITGIIVSSWATPPGPVLQVAPEAVPVASVAQPAMTLASTSSRVADEASNCSPWEVSDVAMEAALNEMIRRGWRPPSQAEVVASFDNYGNPVQAVDPQSSVPVRYPQSAPPPSDNDADATAPFPVDPILPTPEGVSPPLPPAPAPVVEQPAPPSN